MLQKGVRIAAFRFAHLPSGGFHLPVWGIHIPSGGIHIP
jgi:hypothetical protein